MQVIDMATKAAEIEFLRGLKPLIQQSDPIQINMLTAMAKSALILYEALQEGARAAAKEEAGR
jgi:hypothetical protein